MTPGPSSRSRGIWSSWLMTFWPRLAHDEVDGGSAAGEAFEEPPSVGDAGASGDGEDEAALGHRTLFSATHCA
jgi:hypothetical protein